MHLEKGTLFTAVSGAPARAGRALTRNKDAKKHFLTITRSREYDIAEANDSWR